MPSLALHRLPSVGSGRASRMWRGWRVPSTRRCLSLPSRRSKDPRPSLSPQRTPHSCRYGGLCYVLTVWAMGCAWTLVHERVASSERHRRPVPPLWLCVQVGGIHIHVRVLQKHYFPIIETYGPGVGVGETCTYSAMPTSQVVSCYLSPQLSFTATHLLADHMICTVQYYVCTLNIHTHILRGGRKGLGKYYAFARILEFRLFV